MASKKGDFAHLIPDKSILEWYVSREFDGVADLELLKYAKDTRQNVMLYGPTGPGKTSMVLAYAAKEQLPIVTVQANGAVDPNTLFGSWQPDPDDPEGRKIRWVDSSVTEIIVNAPKTGGILYIDEVNFLHPKASAVFHGTLDGRRQVTIAEKNNETTTASQGLQVIVAFNPDYEGTRPLSPAFKNRFPIKLHVGYDMEVESEIVYTSEVVNLASSLRASFNKGVLSTPVSTNMLQEFEQIAVDISYEFAVNNFINAFDLEEQSAVRETFRLHEERLRREVTEMISAAIEEDSDSTTETESKGEAA